MKVLRVIRISKALSILGFFTSLIVHADNYSGNRHVCDLRQETYFELASTIRVPRLADNVRLEGLDGVGICYLIDSDNPTESRIGQGAALEMSPVRCSGSEIRFSIRNLLSRELWWIRCDLSMPARSMSVHEFKRMLNISGDISTSPRGDTLRRGHKPRHFPNKINSPERVSDLDTESITKSPE